MPEWLSHKCNTLLTVKKMIKWLISPSLEFRIVLRKEGSDNSCIQTHRLLPCNPVPNHQNHNIPPEKAREQSSACAPINILHQDPGAPGFVLLGSSMAAALNHGQLQVTLQGHHSQPLQRESAQLPSRVLVCLHLLSFKVQILWDTNQD